jgi:hypothetical protein
VASNPLLSSTVERKEPPNRLPLYLIVALVVLGGGFFGYLQFGPKPVVQDAPLSDEARQYVPNLRLGDVEMKASLNYFSQKVVEINGTIANNGARNLDIVEVTCVFRDYSGQVALRQRVAIVSKKMGGLKPGEKKTFRLPFDALPDGWNQAMPGLVIAGITFS